MIPSKQPVLRNVLEKLCHLHQAWRCIFLLPDECPYSMILQDPTVCPPVSEMKYPDVACYDLYGGGSASLDNNTPYEFEMASGEEVLVKNVDYSGGGQEVQVEYSCGQGSVDTVESAVREWVATLHDPREDYYTYSIKNVECSKEN